MPITAQQHLAHYGVSMEDARTFIMTNLGSPGLIHQIALSYDVTAAMLAEIYGGVSTVDVVAFFNAQGLDGTALDVQLADAVTMRNTSYGRIDSLTAIEVTLPVALRIDELAALQSYVSSSGYFGSNAQVISQANQGDPSGYSSGIRIVPGSDNTFVGGSTELTLSAHDVQGALQRIQISLPQIHFQGTTGNDQYRSTANDELLDLSLGGADTVRLALPPSQGNDWVYGFTPGNTTTDADILDLTAFQLSLGVADRQPSDIGIQAYRVTDTEGINISNQLVLLRNTETNIYLADLPSFFSLGRPFQMEANARAIVIVFESSDNMEDIYLVTNDANMALDSSEVQLLGQLKLNASYVPGTGTYTDGSFMPINFLL